MSKVTLGAANVEIRHDKVENLKKFDAIIDEASEQGVDLLVLPEVGLQGYADFAFPLGSAECAEQKKYYFKEAETIPGPSTEHIRKRLAGSQMIVQLGMAEWGKNGDRIYNSTALIGSGGVMGVYRKTHNQFEFPYFCAGESVDAIETPFGMIGSIICYDLCFPELARAYAIQGADIMLMSTAWPMKGHDRPTDYHGWAMDVSAQANAFFNQCWLVISNHCEKGVYSQGVDYYGGSQIVDPFGKVVEYIADEEGLITHRADLNAAVLESRTEGFFGLNLLQDRRPELYRAISERPEAFERDVLRHSRDRGTTVDDSEMGDS